MAKRCLLPLALALVILSPSGVVRAQPAVASSDLTQRGRIVASGSVGGYWSNDTPTSTASYSTWTVYAHPAIGYFLRDNLGLGAYLDAGWSQGDLFPRGTSESSEIGGGVELIWSLPFARRWSLMLRPSVGYAHERSETNTTLRVTDFNLGPQQAVEHDVRIEGTVDYLRFGARLPFVYALTSQVGIGLGPDLRFDRMLTRARNTDFDPPLPDAGLGLSISFPSQLNRLQIGLSVAIFASF